MINEKVKKDTLLRLRKVEGQVRGLMKMVDEEKYCIDLINQINAIRRALEKVALGILKRHIESCVTESMECKEGSHKIDELVDSIDKFIR